MEEERIKKKITLTIVGIIVFVLILIGTSFAVFSAVSNTEEQTITSGNLSIDFETGQILRTTDIFPIKDSEIETKATELNFSVANTGDIVGYFDIYITDIEIPTALKDLNFKWRLIEGNNIINEGNFLELNEIGLLKRSIKIESNETKEYKILVWLKDNNEEQNYMQGRNLEAKIEVRGKDRLEISPKNEVTVLNDTTQGTVEDLKIYGKTENGVSVGENGLITLEVSQNLIKNGLGELGNNTNFSKLTYNQNKYNSVGSFTISEEKYRVLSNNSPIPINPNKEYYANLCLKNNGTSATYYSGFEEKDIDLEWVNSKHTFFDENTLTYLTEDIENGDKVIYLNNLSNFINNENTSSVRLGLSLWNYVDSREYIWEELTYTRNVWTDLYTYDSIDKSNNTITLKEPWNHGTISKGTKVSQSVSSGSSYKYSLSGERPLTNDWQCLNTNIQNVSTIGNVDNNKFSYGTAYIQLVILNNYNSVPNTITDYSRIVFRESDNKKTITIDISGHEPLKSKGEAADYIDYKNSRIVRKIDNSGNVKEETYEEIELPDIPTYEGNTIIESNDSLSPIFEAHY